MTVTIRPLQETDIPPLWQIAYGQAHEEWQNWNGPYFHDKPMTEEEMRAWVGDHFKNGIFVNGQPVGAVFAYYEDGQMKRWLDIGIVIYADDVWGQGIGTTALRLWLTKVFSMTDLPHIGLTTWSGNQRMMRSAEKLGMQKEAQVRQVRYWQNRYWDSVKYGILREEWEHQQ
ncbi:GNAT family N-acetyltransferase [Schleiferilactobacillus perolens]|jgi:RimJ/RimL family protein N-acetyltransferase|uniref:GNAT family N-acetyltransferase n=1 Tax=Schleiferilactobacillus perolens TaxID=100468 RepID=UPI0023577FBF|nr:GNAT family protein [Schleiferilactobacillus perolens]MCI2170527.1 GNAT family N-acetyltransferase [Schleiferilactobacillus perolens]